MASSGDAQTHSSTYSEIGNIRKTVANRYGKLYSHVLYNCAVQLRKFTFPLNQDTINAAQVWPLFTPQLSETPVTLSKFNSLSIRDLLDARNAYHVHLAHLENVVATAIGRYRIKKSDPESKLPNSTVVSKQNDEPRTLFNTVVMPWSWPCILVFVDRWLTKKEFAKNPDQIVPRLLYLPDGRVVPTCVIFAEDEILAEEEPTALEFPSNMIGGGCPIMSSVQGRIHTGSIACLVTDGDSTYALTNRHVTGPVGREVFAKLGDDVVRVGAAAESPTRKLLFAEAYPGWSGTREFLNLDAGLVHVDDVSNWTTQVFNVCQLGPLVDLNVDTFSLDLIGTKLLAFGAASGPLAGEIQGLFYRYRSVGGFDYVADLLIGPREDQPEAMLTKRGDSGTLWVIENPVENITNSKTKKKSTNDIAPAMRPIAMQWGGHIRSDGASGKQLRFALATSLSTVCRILDVDVVRDWNNGLPEFWGTIGHYTIGALACQNVSGGKLATLMQANLDRVSFDEATILTGSTTPASFFPLADVPDTVWKSGQFKRGRENPNHFADMDEPGQGPFAGQDLFSLSTDPSKIMPADWNAFYESIGTAKSHRGSLPFRVWQLYVAMVSAAKSKNTAEFVGVAGVLAHYVGDACQPLHCSRLHDGDPSIAGSAGVHSAYETKMIGRFRSQLFTTVKPKLASSAAYPTISGGHQAAIATVNLMRRCANTLPPRDIIDSYVSNNHRIADMWSDLKDRTVEVITDGVLTLSMLWESAWVEGNGQMIPNSKIKPIGEADLIALYQDSTFIPSVYLDTMASNTTLFHP